MTVFARTLNTPVGEMLALVESDGALIALPFVRDSATDTLARALAGDDTEVQWDGDAPAETARQLEEYFAGTRRTFTIPLRPRGTPFQRRVWQALVEIPFGQTISYGELARRVGGNTSARAVGRANATNPIPIIVPCHRVIGANGDLTGYGGGMERKAFLLAHEGVIQPSLALTP